MLKLPRIVPCLWYDHQAEEAAALYTAIFPDSRILEFTRYGEAGQEVHGRPPGSVMTVSFELEGQLITALNGGPLFRFTEAVSLQVMCADQAEVDHYWERLAAGGDPAARQCGWLKDRFGLSWQVIPTPLLDMLRDPDQARSQRVFAAMLTMQKLDLAALERACRGPS
jgi:predicted 3-demethylubiquinone-9 3-methyltransferase (glyoxalase superfamily)